MKLFYTILALFALAVVAGGQTVMTEILHVDTTVISPVHPYYGTIQSAIDAADHGDTVMIYDGVYHENLTILQKGITVIEREGHTVTVFGQLRVTYNNPPALYYYNIFKGIDFINHNVLDTSTGAVTVQDGHIFDTVENPVFLEDCSFINGSVGLASNLAGLTMNDCGRVVIVNCAFNGSKGSPESGPGLATNNVSRFYMWSSLLVGGMGAIGPNKAGDGARLDIHGECFLQGNNFIGRDGEAGSLHTGGPTGPVCTEGGSGGHGLDITAHVLRRQDNIFTGGAAGLPISAPCVSGLPGLGLKAQITTTDTVLPGTARDNRCESFLDAGATGVFGSKGEPGDVFFVVRADPGGNGFASFPHIGHSFIKNTQSTRVIAAGVVGSDGQMTTFYNITLPHSPALGLFSGILYGTHCVQTVFVNMDPAGNIFYLGPPNIVTYYDIP